jgi:hypothetical protein
MFNFFSQKTPLQKLEDKLASESNRIFKAVLHKNSNQPNLMLGMLMMASYGSTYESYKSIEMYKLNKSAFNLIDSFSYQDYVELVESVLKKVASKYIEIPEGESDDDRMYHFEP